MDTKALIKTVSRIHSDARKARRRLKDTDAQLFLIQESTGTLMAKLVAELTDRREAKGNEDE